MYENHLMIVDQEQESDLFEDLSQLIKTFKKIMNLSNQIMDSLDEQSPIAQINQLKELPQSSKLLVEHYNSKLQENSPNKNTINRFICRLYEALCLYKGNTYHRSQASVLYKQFLEKSQQAITSYQFDRNVGKMFKKIFYFTQRFCSSCQIIINHGFKQEILNYFSKEEQADREEASPGSQQVLRRQKPNRSQSNFHKAMNVLNRRFSTLSCLDLDYNSFKTYYFQSKNQKQELYRQFLQRNAITWKYINCYSKQFSDYIKKKQKYNLNRKNRFKQKLEAAIKNDGEVRSRHELKNHNKPQIQSQKDRELPALNKNAQKQESPDKKSEYNHCFRDCDPRKTQYHIKNIYLTLNKVNNSSTSAVYEREPRTLHKKNVKQKSSPYSQFKVAKISLKGSKTNEHQKPKNKPLLQIKQIESREYGYTLDHSMAQQISSNVPNFGQTRQFKGRKMHISKKSISQKKSIRLTQLLNNKSTVNTKAGDPLGQSEMMYEIRVLNCEDDEFAKS